MEGEAEGTVPLAELRRMGAEGADDDVERRLAGVVPSDVATIVYTSGTTGPPKGCVRRTGTSAPPRMYEHELDLGGDLAMYLYLPLAHSLARIAQAVALQVGGTLAFWGGDAKKIIEEVARAEPTHFPSVPRVYEKIHTAVLSGVAGQSRPQRRRVRAGRSRWGAGRRPDRRAGGPVSRARPVRHGVGRPARALARCAPCSAAGCSWA